MNKEELLAKLNPSQQAAVEYNDGPSLVIAGAGSGKTRVLTYKIAYLIQLGLDPRNILALTFTNKAANEMKTRIGDLIGMESAHYVNMGTFHSVFSRILRVEAHHIGFDSHFTIYDENDSRSLIKTIVKEMMLDEKMYKPSTVHNRISMAKNTLITAQQYANDAELFERDRYSRMPEVGKIYIAYQERCRRANAMDFDDLLVMTYELFRQHDDIRRKWVERFKYILVDEYQDTNKVQQMIVDLLAMENKRICVVGDDAQSIYSFRGANIDNILNFTKIYPEAKLFKLEQNYRSTQRIVEAANSLIRHNQRQIRKEVFSENDLGDSLQVKPAYSDKEEAAIVCRDIKKYMRQHGGKYSDFAILYRTNAQSRPFEDEFLRQSIPYRIYGGLSFYQRKEIKDILAYFRLVANHNDEEAFKRIVNYPARGIGDTTMSKVAAAATQHGVSFWDVCYNLDRYAVPINGGAKTKLVKFVAMIQHFSDQMNVKEAYDLGREIVMQSGIHADLFSSSDAEYLTRQENLEELMAAMQDFVEGLREEGRAQEATLDRFLQEVSLMSDKESGDEGEPQVSLMTVHAAKGLEFPVVFVVGMEENIFPSSMAQDSPRELEEERRLLYVAITRAEKLCVLTCAKNRWRYGKMEYDVPSRFLQEIDSRFITFDGEDMQPASRRQIQNSRPVANQFMADVDYKITSPRRSEPKVDPLSPAFRRELDAARNNPFTPHGAKAAGFQQATQIKSQQLPPNFRKVSSSSRPANSVNPSSAGSQLAEGMVIEHQRFGVGTVIRLEGAGDNAKATVEFRNTGIKQLLLKFAKFTVVK